MEVVQLCVVTNGSQINGSVPIVWCLKGHALIILPKKFMCLNLLMIFILENILQIHEYVPIFDWIHNLKFLFQVVLEWLMVIVYHVIIYVMKNCHYLFSHLLKNLRNSGIIEVLRHAIVTLHKILICHLYFFCNILMNIPGILLWAFLERFLLLIA